MRKPPPQHANVLYHDLMEYLPDIPAAQAASTAFTLAQFSPDEVSMYWQKKLSIEMHEYDKNDSNTIIITILIVKASL